MKTSTLMLLLVAMGCQEREDLRGVGPEGPEGPPGEQGEPGEMGSPGAMGTPGAAGSFDRGKLYQVSESEQFLGSQSGDVVALCDPGDTIISGGCNAETPGTALWVSFGPLLDDANGDNWTCSYNVTVADPLDTSKIFAFNLCLRAT